MNRQPNPGSDKNTWGTVLNSYLSQLSPSDKGGINYWTNSTKPTGLTTDDEGRTGVNTETQSIERWSGTAWAVLLSAQTSQLTTADVDDSTDRRYVTDSQLVVVGNTSNTNTGDETNNTIITKIGYTPESISNKNIVGGYAGVNEFGRVDPSLSPNMNVGWFTDEGTLPGGYTDPTLLGNIENTIGYRFKTTNAYHNIYFSVTGANGVFNRKIKPWLDLAIPKNVNFFCEFRGQTPGGLAQLADVKNGTNNGGIAGDIYGDNLNGLLNEIQNYFTANPTKVGKCNVRIILMHEFQLPDYETGLAYNRVDGNDWYSAAANVSKGVNNPADYLPAFARLSGIIKAHSAWTNGLCKIVPCANGTWSSRYKLADYIPPRNQYDYYGVDIYDRYQNSSGPAFYSANIAFILQKSGQMCYQQIVDATDAPIILCETGSSSRTGKYSRVRRFEQGLYDFMYDTPQVVEWTYFAPSGSDWEFSTEQLIQLKPIFYKIQNRLTEDQRKKVLNVKSNVITTDLNNISSWTAAGANVGVKTMVTTTTTSSAGSDETDKNSSTVALSMIASGTDPLANYLYITESTSVLEGNVPHMLSFQAYTDSPESDGDVYMYVNVINSSDSYANLRGNFWLKLGREAKTYNVGILKGWVDSTVKIVFAIGHNTQTSGSIYISVDSVKLEKGEVPTPVIKPVATSYLSPLLPSDQHIFAGPANTSQAATANQIMYASIHIPQNCTATSIEWTNGTVVSGNVKVGLYKVGSVHKNNRANVLDTSTLVASSNSIAQSGVSSPQVADFTSNVSLTPGVYFMALMFDNSTATFNRHGGSAVHYNLGYTTNEASFTLPAVAAAGTAVSSSIPGLRLRLTSNYP